MFITYFMYSIGNNKCNIYNVHVNCEKYYNINIQGLEH